MGIVRKHQVADGAAFAVSKDMHSVCSSFIERHGRESLRFSGQPVIDFAGPCGTELYSYLYQRTKG